jgi:hypothetical protein
VQPPQGPGASCRRAVPSPGRRCSPPSRVRRPPRPRVGWASGSPGAPPRRAGPWKTAGCPGGRGRPGWRGATPPPCAGAAPQAPWTTRGARSAGAATPAASRGRSAGRGRRWAARPLPPTPRACGGRGSAVGRPAATRATAPSRGRRSRGATARGQSLPLCRGWPPGAARRPRERVGRLARPGPTPRDVAQSPGTDGARCLRRSPLTPSRRWWRGVGGRLPTVWGPTGPWGRARRQSRGWRARGRKPWCAPAERGPASRAL